jgi:hypothetical protein
MSTADSIKAVLTRLRNYVGTGETPPGSNDNFIVRWYNANVAAIGRGPWCEMTNTWAMWTSGFKTLKKGRAYTPWACEDAQKGVNGSSWHWGTKGMRAGDEVYYDWAGNKGDVKYVDHTGTVEKVMGDGTFYVFEGNKDDKLVRIRRDGRFVVGYIRFDWSRVPGTGVVEHPKPPVVQSPTKALTKKIQTALKVTSDGQWGPHTDERARRLRNAAMTKAGWPKKSHIGFDIRDVQEVTGAGVDGVWGPNSQAHLTAWVNKFQKLAGVTADGVWGPKTDNAFLVIRKKNNNNY